MLFDAAAVAWLDDGPAGPVLLGTSGLAAVAAWGVGRYVPMRRSYLEERRRIARDLHDQVAHQLGVVSLQTAAARRWLDRDPERTAAALEAAERSARSALTTMPTILEALRADDGAPHGLTPQETLADIDRLVSDVVAGRLSVTLRVKREPRPWILPWSSPRSVSSRRR